VFFYAMGTLITTIGLALGLYGSIRRIGGHELTIPTVVLISLLVISGFQFLLFAMWFDMDYNRGRDNPRR